MYTDFKPGDKVFEISNKEIDLFSPLRIGTFLRETPISDGFEDCEVLWDDGTECRTFSSDLSLIPVKDDTRVQIYPAPCSLVPSESVPAVYRAGRIWTLSTNEPYRGDMILTREIVRDNSDVRRRSCDFFDVTGRLVREGDIVKMVNPTDLTPHGYWEWVVLWDYDKHGWHLFELTADGYRTGNAHSIHSSLPLKAVGHVWTVPPMEYGISEQHNLIPSPKLIRARNK